MSRAEMQQALEALEKWETKLRWAAISALKQALAEPEQEPVAFYIYKPTLPRGNLGSLSDGDLPWVYDQDPSSGFSARMLVTPYPPASKPWVGLTEEEVDECYYWKGRQWTTDELVRHVEAKLREKNNG